ncbi:hypothetical protein T12_2304 [Trichinella patagoniensis]|uniref:Uncharacterized protein n=1 Tax=Trichinella patagoniensis TaxID=990121 RepID=A0A0V0Z3E5_9BILA|nr:hypothetical protein T12_2304 [Trichinella patagoniensis]
MEIIEDAARLNSYAQFSYKKMQFFLTLRDKEKHQNRRKRNLRVASAATKQKFSDDDSALM